MPTQEMALSGRRVDRRTFFVWSATAGALALGVGGVTEQVRGKRRINSARQTVQDSHLKQQGTYSSTMSATERVVGLALLSNNSAFIDDKKIADASGSDQVDTGLALVVLSGLLSVSALLVANKTFEKK